MGIQSLNGAVERRRYIRLDTGTLHSMRFFSFLHRFSLPVIIVLAASTVGLVVTAGDGATISNAVGVWVALGTATAALVLGLVRLAIPTPRDRQNAYQGLVDNLNDVVENRDADIKAQRERLDASEREIRSLERALLKMVLHYDLIAGMIRQKDSQLADLRRRLNDPILPADLIPASPVIFKDGDLQIEDAG